MESGGLLTSDDVPPALVGAAWRSGGVGGHEAAASLVRLVARGHVAVSPAAGSDVCTFQLDRSKSRRGPHDLDSMDRELVAAVFRNQSAFTMGQLLAASSVGSQPMASGIQKWRHSVEREAVRRHMSGAAAIVSRHELRHVRSELSRLLAEAARIPGTDLPARAVELAVVFGFERKLQLALPVPSSEDAPHGAQAAARWLCSARCGRSTVVACLRRALSARPSPSPLKLGVTRPTHQIPRVIDDGKTRLGG